MKRFFIKALIGIVALPFILVLLLLAFTFFYPDWLLSPVTINFAKNLVEKSGSQLDLQITEKDVLKDGWGVLKWHIALNEGCFKSRDLEICAEQTAITLRTHFLSIHSIGPVTSNKISIIERAKSPEPEKEVEPLTEIPRIGILPKLEKIDIKSFLFVSTSQNNETNVSGSLVCDPRKDQDSVACRLDTTFRLVEGESSTLGLVGLNALLGPKDYLKAHAELTLKPSGESKPFTELTLDAEDGSTTEQKYQIKGWTLVDFFRLSLSANGKLSSNRREFGTTLNLSAEKTNVKNSSMNFSLKDCETNLALEKLSLSVSQCEIISVIKGLDQAPFKLNWSGGIELGEKSLPFRLTFPKQSAQMLKINSLFAGDFGNEGDHFALAKESYLDLTISSFEKLSSLLSETPFAVPAPVNAMKGTIEVRVDSASLEQEGLRFPFSANLDLSHQSQHFKTEAKGTMLMAKAGKPSSASISIDLKDIALKLPDLELRSPPQLIPDSRFGKEAKKAVPQKDSNLVWDLELKTPDSGSVALVSNLISAPVPVAINGSLDSKSNVSLDVSIRPFELEIFKRKARVKRFNAKIKSNAESSLPIPIEGDIEVNYPDYTVNILISGTENRPKVILQSSPPLSRQQIIALLLFGESPDDLDVGAGESVASMDSAIVQRSVTLASLYFLASSPIQSIGYDPETGQLSAKFRLDDKTLIQLSSSDSSDKESYSVGFRRRIGKHWRLSTDLELHDDLDARSDVSTFLDWFTRY